MEPSSNLPPPDSGLTEADRRELLEMSAEITAATDEPKCVCEAFKSRVNFYVFTMQTWIDLEAADSPLLKGKWPLEQPDLEAAFQAFGFAGVIEASAEEAAAAVRRMREEVRAGLGMALRMRPPGKTVPAEEDGFGTWLPILAALIAQLGMARAEALACPVGQGLALLAGHRRNEGWSEAGRPYAMRGEEEIPRGGAENAEA
jgi:hypothetical protein